MQATQKYPTQRRLRDASSLLSEGSSSRREPVLFCKPPDPKRFRMYSPTLPLVWLAGWIVETFRIPVCLFFNTEVMDFCATLEEYGAAELYQKS